MENNEIMQVADDVMNESTVTGTIGKDLGKGMLIGAGVTAAVFATVELVKRGITAFKAKKAKEQAEQEYYETVDADA